MRPSRERGQGGLVLDDDVARALEMVAIEHRVAGDEEAEAGLAPARVEPAQRGGRVLRLINRALALAEEGPD